MFSDVSVNMIQIFMKFYDMVARTNNLIDFELFTLRASCGAVYCNRSCLNLGRPAPLGRGSAAAQKFWAPPYYSQHTVFASPTSAFFIVNRGVRNRFF